MSKIQVVLAQARAPGVYRFRSRASEMTLRRALEKAGWRLFYLDGREIRDKTSFLQACAAAMEFPTYFRPNWDAFEECVNDLSWMPAQGYVVLFDRAGQFELSAPRDWATAMDIFEDAVASWRDAGTPMYVLVRGAEAIYPDL
ncbi:MAG: hypothetical protein KatS3mg053_0331 [Candidatus Roseilinea sp.]|nr:MAG: hypothetical protein KatS3mg053_0331 [Candidatus Roseilinea sp.]